MIVIGVHARGILAARDRPETWWIPGTGPGVTWTLPPGMLHNIQTLDFCSEQTQVGPKKSTVLLQKLIPDTLYSITVAAVFPSGETKDISGNGKTSKCPAVTLFDASDGRWLSRTDGLQLWKGVSFVYEHNFNVTLKRTQAAIFIVEVVCLCSYVFIFVNGLFYLV